MDPTAIQDWNDMNFLMANKFEQPQPTEILSLMKPKVENSSLRPPRPVNSFLLFRRDVQVYELHIFADWVRHYAQA